MLDNRFIDRNSEDESFTIADRHGVMIMAEKDNFVVKALVKKVKDAGYDSCYTRTDINDINRVWDKIVLVVYYMDNNDRLSADTLHFLKDQLTDTERKMIVIGDPADTRHITEKMPQKLILKTFKRPLDNDAFFAAIKSVVKDLETEHKKKTILIVDDDPTYMGLVRDWLKDTYKVAMAVSGLQAIKWLGANHADLVLLDHEMPVTNGPKVLEMLRSDHETRNIPVIFLTGKSDKQSVMEVVAIGAEGYLLKTIEKDDLLKQLFEFFEKRKG